MTIPVRVIGNLLKEAEAVSEERTRAICRAISGRKNVQQVIDLAQVDRW